FSEHSGAQRRRALCRPLVDRQMKTGDSWLLRDVRSRHGSDVRIRCERRRFAGRIRKVFRLLVRTSHENNAGLARRLDGRSLWLALDRQPDCSKGCQVNCQRHQPRRPPASNPVRRTPRLLKGWLVYLAYGPLLTHDDSQTIVEQSVATKTAEF